jgi:hypothetical protein
LIQAICRGIKLGYTNQNGEDDSSEKDEQIQEFQVRKEQMQEFLVRILLLKELR